MKACLYFITFDFSKVYSDIVLKSVAISDMDNVVETTYRCVNLTTEDSVALFINQNFTVQKLLLYTCFPLIQINQSQALSN